MPIGSTVYERLAPDPKLVDAALEGTQHKVFWLDGVGDDLHFPALSGTVQADLAVVGGGYCGLWTAVLAKRRNPGARVVLVEAEQVGWAASGRNGGFCEASLTHGEDNGRSRWPAEYDVLERLGHTNLDALEQDLDELGIDSEFQRNGVLAVAVEPHQVPWLQQRSAGEFLDATAARAEFDSPIVLAGRWDRHDAALVHPGKLAKGLARAAAELGVEIFENSAVVAIDTNRRTSAVAVRTEQGVVRADQVALATNVFRSLLPSARLLTVPVYDYVLMTEPLSSEQLASVGWANRQGVTDLANQFHYTRLTADNRILYGGYDAIYHRGRKVRSEYENRSDSYRRLAAHFLTMFPQLADVAFSHQWAGAVDTSTQFCAFHGLARSGRVAYAAGFTGLGVGATRFAAEVMLDRLGGIANERTGLQMVQRKPLPFPVEPFTAAGIALTRWSLDRADHREGRRNLFLRTLDALGLGFDS